MKSYGLVRKSRGCYNKLPPKPPAKPAAPGSKQVITIQLDGTYLAVFGLILFIIFIVCKS